MMYAGIDAGSRAIKIIILNGESLQLVASGIEDQGIKQEEIARDLFESICEQNGIKRSDIRKIIATGYGRNLIHFADTQITEITCHACGVRHYISDAMTIIDIGGQDSKVIKLRENGVVQDFSMNDRCAAGTGRFLEIVAQRLNSTLETFGEQALRSTTPSHISNMCVVFAETEIIGLLASNTPTEDIGAGVMNAVISRVISMAGRHISTPVIFTGGVAQIPGMKKALESILQKEVTIPPHPQYTGALGAALLAAREVYGS